jgi:predicted dehydrogenase
MAHTRGQAFLDTGQAEICAVASRRLEKARECASNLGCSTYFDDYRHLGEASPDAILIEVPHAPQDDVTMWALKSGYDVLVGGTLASSVRAAEEIIELVVGQKLIVEAGFQRRYDPSWAAAHQLVQQRQLGDPIVAVTSALWNPDPGRWYYDQHESGGMPLTHMSYAYMNAIRWIMGEPITVFAMSNRKVETLPERVSEETCSVLVGFEDGAFVSATASYAGQQGMGNPEPQIVCTRGGIQFNPEGSSGLVSMDIFQDGESETRSFNNEPAPLVRQATRFLNSIATRQPTLNPPEDALIDVQIAEAISVSVQEQRIVKIQGD